MRSHHDSFPAPFLESAGPARRSPATAAAHPVSNPTARACPSSASSLAAAPASSASPSSARQQRAPNHHYHRNKNNNNDNETPPTKQFTPTARARNRPTSASPTRNCSPTHNYRGKLALALVTPPTPTTPTPTTPTPTTPTTRTTTTETTTKTTTKTNPDSIATSVSGASTTPRRRQPLAIRQNAANKMRNLHTSRSSPYNNTNNTITTKNKDHSALSSSSSSPVPRMPYDRSTPTAPSSRQHPQAPSLAKRTPVTPKLAAKPTTSSLPSQRQTVTLAAPVPRKPTRPESTVSQSTASNLGASATKRVSGSNRDVYASPASHILHNHVTPRHDNRQSRTSSATTSPSPGDAPTDAWESRSGLGMAAAAPALEADAARRNPPTATNRDSKFFYASDASKGAQPPTSSSSRPTPTLSKAPTFFYANGTNLPPKSSPTLASPAPFSPPLAAPTSDPLGGKFMYASGTPDLKPSSITSGTASVISTSSKRASSKIGSGPQSPAFVAQRAPSPAKVTSHPAPAPSAPGPSIAERRSVQSSTPQMTNTSLRRISTEAPPRKSSGHSRSGSLIAEPPSVTRTVATSPPASSPLLSPLAFSTQGLSMASVLQAAEEAAEFVDHDDNESMVSGLASPKSSKGDDPLNELVANARRERKVQDLQITNASLEAINRTLERQLRKQTNELRRYKRLSRAVRLSSANTAPSSRIASDSTMSETPEGPLNELSLSDLSEEGEDDMDQDDEDLEESELSESESSGSAYMSPDTAAARDEKYRKRDENRLQIDLSKHQQLLVDSQKMNQSLKRCLGWTEELIKEGKRALAYQVRVSEVDIGGRVTHEDGEKPFIYDGAALWDHSAEQDEHSLMDNDGLSDDGQDGDADETMRLRIERLRPADAADDGTKGPQDRDSGIVLPGDAA